MKKHATIILLFSLVGLAALLLMRPLNQHTPESGASDLSAIAHLQFTTLEGETRTLGDFSGQPLVLNAWATWCPFCKNELPDFAAVQEEFSDDVLFIAINRGERVASAKAFVDEYGIGDRLLFLQDERDSFYDAVGGFSMPETLFYDAAGNLVEHKRGPLTEQQTRERVERLITTTP